MLIWRLRMVGETRPGWCRRHGHRLAQLLGDGEVHEPVGLDQGLDLELHPGLAVADLLQAKLVVPSTCWLLSVVRVITGISLPTSMLAVSPLLTSSRGRERMTTRSSL